MLVKSSSAPRALLLGLAMLIILSVAFPNSSFAAKPEQTGQERAASVGNKTDETDEESSAEDDESSDEDEDEEDDDSKENKKANKGDDKKVGLARAAEVVKKEEIRTKLLTMLELIQQMQSRLDEMKGIGNVVRDLNKGGDDDGDDTPEPVSLLAATLVSSQETLVVNDDVTTEDDAGEFVLDLEVTALDGDLLIPNTAGTEDATTTGVVLSIVSASGTTISSGTVTATVETDGDQDAVTDDFVILEGETAVLTITVVYDPVETNFYRVQLKSVNTDLGTETLSPTEEFRSDALSINN